MMFAIFLDPCGVEAVNSSMLTLNPYDFNSLTMYARVFVSAGVSGGLGPISNCFLTWVIARAPLNALRIGGGVGGGELEEVLTRAVEGISLRGQPPSTSGRAATKPAAMTRRASHPLSLVILYIW